MFAINHAATGLLIKKAFPEVPMVAILVSVQLIEVLWVVLNALGIEKTTTEASVASVRDVQVYIDRVAMLMGHVDRTMLYRRYGKYVKDLEQDAGRIRDFFGKDFMELHGGGRRPVTSEDAT